MSSVFYTNDLSGCTWISDASYVTSDKQFQELPFLHSYRSSHERNTDVALFPNFAKGQYLFHGPIGLRLHLGQQKDWPFSMVVPNQSFIEILRHPTFYLIRYVGCWFYFRWLYPPVLYFCFDLWNQFCWLLKQVRYIVLFSITFRNTCYTNISVAELETKPR